jgi:hypothetical protein
MITLAKELSKKEKTKATFMLGDMKNLVRVSAGDKQSNCYYTH